MGDCFITRRGGGSENLDAELTTQETTIDDIETALHNKVSPPAPPPRILTDDDLIPENIKKGVDVLGVTGTYEGPYAVTKESFSVRKISVSSVTLTPPSGFNHLAYVGIADSFVAYGTAPTIKITIPDANGTTVNVTMTGSGTLTLLAVWSKL